MTRTTTILSKVIGDKKEWKAMQARAAALPADYRDVYDDITSYMWELTTGDGRATLAALGSVITQFEHGATHQRPVRHVTGADVAAYCDERLEAHGAASYVDVWRAPLTLKA